MPGRDIIEEQRYGLYSADTWSFRGAKRITADELLTRQRDLPDAGLLLDRDPRRDKRASMSRWPA